MQYINQCNKNVHEINFYWFFFTKDEKLDIFLPKKYDLKAPCTSDQHLA